MGLCKIYWNSNFLYFNIPKYSTHAWFGIHGVLRRHVHVFINYSRIITYTVCLYLSLIVQFVRSILEYMNCVLYQSCMYMYLYIAKPGSLLLCAESVADNKPFEAAGCKSRRRSRDEQLDDYIIESNEREHL